MSVRLTQTAARRATAPCGGLRVMAVAKPAQKSVAKGCDERQMQAMKALAFSAVASNLLAGPAQAAQEVTQLAGGDGRAGVLLTLFVPAIGWVLFNILGPAKNQIDDMSAKGGKTKSTVVGLGLGASLLAAGSADAAQQVADVAGGDGRAGVLLTLFVPAIGWVLFNILGPAKNQIDDMSAKGGKTKSTVVGLGLGASLLAAGSADAAQQIADVAGGDNRLSVLLTLFVPAIGWVLFNILGPAKNQVDDMASKNKK